MERNTAGEREIEIDLGALFRELFRKIGIILLSTCITAVAALLISMFFISPKYQSVTKVYILSRQQGDTAVTYNDLQTATQLTSDYEQLIKSRYVMEMVIADLGLDMSADQLAGSVVVESSSGTRILEIKVENNDPYLAKNIANRVREVAGKQIVEIMSIDAVNVVDEANLPLSPVSPDIKKNTLFGALAGFFISCVVITLLFLLNDSIKTPEDVEKYMELSVLGIIPQCVALNKERPYSKGTKRQGAATNQKKS